MMVIIQIQKIIKKNLIGKINYINYHVGQYLPDWHPWEKKGHYVWEKDSNGCKELVPFELTWLSKFFGKPKFLNSVSKKLSIYQLSLMMLLGFQYCFQKKF
jgi:hypothetical protein